MLIGSGAVIGAERADTSDVKVAIRGGDEPSRPTAIVRVELVIIHRRPGIAAVSAFAHQPVAPVISFHGRAKGISQYVQVAGRVGPNTSGAGVTTGVEL